VLRGPGGTPIGIAGFVIRRTGGHGDYDLGVALRAAGDPDPDAPPHDAYPAFVVASLNCYEPAILGPRNAADWTAALAAAEDLARELGCRTLLVLALPHGSALEQSVRDRDLLLVGGAPETLLDVSWPDMEQYLASLSRKSCRAATRERRVLAERGVRLSTAGAEALDGVLERLLVGHFARHGLPADRAGVQERFAGIREHLSAETRVLLARRGGRTLGFSLYFLGDGTLYTRLTAFVADEPFLYFNLAYYGVVEDALSVGATTIRYGSASYEAKLRRGARLRPLRIGVRSSSAALTARLTAPERALGPVRGPARD
jgi:hypothetical protein